MTCNPAWDEIQHSLLPGQTARDRPDIVSRVFKKKLDELIRELTADGILGKTVAHLFVVEFQKRGLPHAHILLILHSRDRPKSADDIDGLVRAELPSDDEKPQRSDFESEEKYVEALKQFKELRRIVEECMLHRECGRANPLAPCMKNGCCEKFFPKDFQSATTWNELEIYPRYRRRSPSDGGAEYLITERSGRSRVVNNSWVVPYNPYLSLKYKCHINVEVCISVASVKYLCVAATPCRESLALQNKQLQAHSASVPRRPPT